MKAISLSAIYPSKYIDPKRTAVKDAAVPPSATSSLTEPAPLTAVALPAAFRAYLTGRRCTPFVSRLFRVRPAAQR